MKTIEIIFWIALLLIGYTYVGYGVIMYILVKIKRLVRKNKRETADAYQPEVTLMIAAYNEKDYVNVKVQNSKQLNYPSAKLKQVWVTDGSDDGTPDILKEIEGIELLHKQERKGKIAAINRGMQYVNTPIVIFTDANTMLNNDAVKEIVECFKDPKVGCVSGEKRILDKHSDNASGAGEGLYWKYESALKKMDSELNTAVGAAGELFAVRKELFEDTDKDVLLDDFVISLKIAMKGYKIAYTSKAYAIETASANTKEELKRKIRISAGGIQSVIKLKPLLNIFRYGLLSFQYISHRVLRWTLTPLALPILFITNILLVNTNIYYKILLILQTAFYVFSLLGWALEQKNIKLKLLFAPFYFSMMNFAVYMGFVRFLKGKQSVLWERAKRSV